MFDGIHVCLARQADVPAMARVHVEAWAETYRGLTPDSILDDPNFITAQEKQWTATLTNPLFSDYRTAVAVQHESIVGIAMSGPSGDESSPLHLYVLYVLAPWRGPGEGGRRRPRDTHGPERKQRADLRSTT